MNVPVWAAELANAFWSAAGEAEPFPRRLLGPIAAALPLTVAYLPRLTLTAIRERLARCGVNSELSIADRSLRACLVAGQGHGFVFIDGTDPENEQRFSLAHELAHFLRDYCRLRRIVQNRLGQTALEVLDGRRAATTDERMHALLQQTGLPLHVHLMDRIENLKEPDALIADAENCADRLAFELLAPAHEISVADARDRKKIAAQLVDGFGLPAKPAERYAAILLPPPRRVDPLLDWLRNPCSV